MSPDFTVPGIERKLKANVHLSAESPSCRRHTRKELRNYDGGPEVEPRRRREANADFSKVNQMGGPEGTN